MDEHEHFEISGDTLRVAIGQGAPILAVMYRSLRAEGLEPDEAAALAVRWWMES